MNGFIGVFRSKDVGPETQNMCVSEYIGVIASTLELLTDSNVHAIRSGYISIFVHTACLFASVCGLYVSVFDLELYVCVVFKRGGADPRTEYYTIFASILLCSSCIKNKTI